MTGIPQILQITPTPPSELIFTGPFNKMTNATLKIFNPSLTKIAYRIRITHPNRYSVVPNIGLIEPNAEESISFKYLPCNTLPMRRSHRIQVIAFYMPGDNEDPMKLWEVMPRGALMKTVVNLYHEIPQVLLDAALLQAQSGTGLKGGPGSASVITLYSGNAATPEGSEIALPELLQQVQEREKYEHVRRQFATYDENGDLNIVTLEDSGPIVFEKDNDHGATLLYIICSLCIGLALAGMILYYL